MYDVKPESITPIKLAAIMATENCSMEDCRRAAACIRDLNDALREMVKECSCRGTGTRYKACTLCGDSTYDHYCNDTEVQCTNERCIKARAVLGERVL